MWPLAECTWQTCQNDNDTLAWVLCTFRIGLHFFETLKYFDANTFLLLHKVHFEFCTFTFTISTVLYWYFCMLCYFIYYISIKYEYFLQHCYYNTIKTLYNQMSLSYLTSIKNYNTGYQIADLPFWTWSERIMIILGGIFWSKNSLSSCLRLCSVRVPG